MASLYELRADYGAARTYLSYAKLNLQLAVFPKEMAARLHPLGSLFHTITLADKLSITPAEKYALSVVDETAGQTLSGDSGFTERNLLTRTWRYLKNRYPLAGELHLTLHKRIPTGAGLGGGSSNAAALINWAQAAYGFQITNADRLTMVQELGSDVPFFLTGGMAWVENVGEQLSPLAHSLASANDELTLLVVETELKLKTQTAYAEYVTWSVRRDYLTFKRAVQRAMLDADAAVRSRELLFVLTAMAANAFAAKILAAHADLAAVYGKFKQCYPYTLFSGSGSAFFCCSHDKISEAFLQTMQESPGIVKVHRTSFTARGAMEVATAG